MWQIFPSPKQWADWVTLSVWTMDIREVREQSRNTDTGFIFSARLAGCGVCGCMWVCRGVCVCVSMHEYTHAKWGFRESRLHKAWRRTEQEKAAWPLSDLWSRLCASRRESVVWGHSRGWKEGCYRDGVHVFGEEGVLFHFNHSDHSVIYDFTWPATILDWTAIK